tara:strand:+ start:302 stop:1096 length:795 start_codon:yes stop_codon:yes gene_type:complete
MPKIKKFPEDFTNISVIHKGKSRHLYRCKQNEKILCCKIIPVQFHSWKIELSNLKYIAEHDLPYPKFYDHFTDINNSYMFYDYIQGIDLYKYAITRDLSEKSVKIITYKIIKLLTLYHSKNVWHLDIKPENIICINNDITELALIDFGHAFVCHSKKCNTTHSFGTIGYAAPELKFGKCYSKSDVWSLGVIIYVLLFKSYPFPHQIDESKKMKSYIKAFTEEWEKNFKTVTKEAVNIITSCLKEKISERAHVTDLLNHKWFDEI